jgi:hypothetical protein
MSQSLILIDILSSTCLEKNEKNKKKERKKREVARGFFPRAGARHPFVAVPGRIFVTVRCN